MADILESARLKLVRAKQHLDELRTMAADLSDSRPYEVTERVEPEGQQRYVYRASVVEQVDPLFAVVLGDFLFCLRSALDHTAVALVPRKRQCKASFPIVPIDIWTVDENRVSNRKEYRSRRKQWTDATEGMPAQAVTYIEGLQPGRHPDLPENQLLAVLARLQNADKHRTLLAVAQGLRRPVIVVRSSEGILVRRGTGTFENDTVAHMSDTQVDVTVEGAVEIAFHERGREGTERFTLRYFEAMLEHVRDVIVLPLSLLLG